MVGFGASALSALLRFQTALPLCLLCSTFRPLSCTQLHSLCINRAWHAVVNIFGIWFELRRQEGSFKAFQVAHLGMELVNFPMDGLDYNAVALSGEEILTLAQELTPINNPVKKQCSQPLSQTMHGQPPPHDIEDNPFRVANLMNNPIDDKLVQLEGIPLDRFEGDQAKTHQFLIQFKWFMMMNC